MTSLASDVRWLGLTRYIPHAVDTKVFKPLDRQEAREHLEWPQDKVHCWNGRSRTRVIRQKAFYRLAAFAALHAQHPDTMLYLHTDAGLNGGDVGEFAEIHQPDGVETWRRTLCFAIHTITDFGFPTSTWLITTEWMLTNVALGEGILVFPITGSAGLRNAGDRWRLDFDELCFARLGRLLKEEAVTCIDFL